MPPKQKYRWPYVKTPPLNPNPLAGPPSSPEPDSRRQKRRKRPESSSELDEFPKVQEKETTAVVAESDSSAEDKPSDDHKKFLAKQTRARVQTFNLYFNELSEDIQQQRIETSKPGYQHKRTTRREVLDFVVPKTSLRQINPNARTQSPRTFCAANMKRKRRRISV